MSRRAATITQADIARAIRAAKQAGAAEVEIRIDGKATIIIRLGQTTIAYNNAGPNSPMDAEHEFWAQDPPKIKL